MKTTLKRIFFLIAILPLLVLVYSFVWERTNLEIKSMTISSEKFSKNFSGLKLVQLSDIHLKKLTKYENRVISKVNGLNADLILITGDFFHHKNIFERPESHEFIENMESIEKFIRSLHSKYGIYICRGNNDFSNDKQVSDIFLNRLNSLHIKVLSNIKENLFLNGQDFLILGVDFPEFNKQEVADFYVNNSRDGSFFQVNSSLKNSYSHFSLVNEKKTWKNYTFSGRFRQSDPLKKSLGFTFYSQFDRGFDRFYRLRRRAGFPYFQLEPHGADRPDGDIEVDTEIKDNTWYLFRIKCLTYANRSEIYAKIWPQEQMEPEYWQARAVDSSSHRIESGTIGLWSAGEGWSQFDDLCVLSQQGDTLLLEDFEHSKNGSDPFGWVDFNYEREAIPVMMNNNPDSCYSILLAHSPDFITWAQESKVDLVLSGHTHGGQIRLPFWGALIARIEIGRKFTQGFSTWGNTTLYVNRGIGTIVLPLRIMCRPEITVFNLSVMGQ